MNTREIAAFDDWDEAELSRLVAQFVRIFHRLPRGEELPTFRRHRARLHLRIPLQTRRSLATLLATM